MPAAIIRIGLWCTLQRSYIKELCGIALVFLQAPAFGCNQDGKRCPCMEQPQCMGHRFRVRSAKVTQI